MGDPSKVVVRNTPVSTRRFEHVLGWFLDCVRMLEHFRARRLDANGVGDRELVQYGGDCFQ
jgi:hypothetical protein